MIDTTVIAKLVEDQIAKSVNEQVLEVFSTDEWLKPIEQKIVDYTQQRILGKFANSSALPEIVEAIKQSVAELFENGKIPGVDEYIDSSVIKQSIDIAVENNILTAIHELGKDPVWLEKIERMVNQTMVQRVVAGLASIDINDQIRCRVDENMADLDNKIVKKLQTPGIQDLAENCELTIMDGNVVIENCLTTNKINVMDSASIKDLSVTGSINVDNRSWQTLSEHVSDQTLKKLNHQWRESLIADVAQKIKHEGINFDDVRVDGEKLISGNSLSKKITTSGIRSLGALQSLTVDGEAHINNTVSVLNRRLGVNTQTPEMALSVWDEEISLLAGKFKDKVAYIGTGRAQGLSIGVNRTPAVDIDVDGLTTVKKLRIGIHKLSYASELPNYSGTKGEVVFNANPTLDSNIFAWQCLGGFKWKVIKAVE